MTNHEFLNKSSEQALRRNMLDAAIKSAAMSGKRFIEAAESTFPATTDRERMVRVHEEVLRDLAKLKPHVLPLPEKKGDG